MHGFTAIFSKNTISKSVSIKWKPDFFFQSPTVERTIGSSKHIISQKTSKKFLDEKLWIDNNELLMVTEGVILNIQKLKEENNVATNEQLIIELFKKDKLFFQQFEGNFAGFYLLKESNEVYFFNNPAGTKRVFYYNKNNLLLAGTDLQTLSHTIKQLNLPCKLNNLSARLMLNSGYMFENLTLIEDVYHLRAGEYLHYQYGEISTDFYFNINSIEKNSDSREEIIYNLDERFKNAVRLGFEFNNRYDLGNLTTISAGLDSRMVALMGDKLGYKDQLWLNFSEPGYAEQVISKQIAREYNYPLLQFDLKPGSLIPIDEIIRVNDALGIYTGYSHMFSVSKHLNASEIGVIHTGNMADTVMGSCANADYKHFDRKAFASKFRQQEAENYINELRGSYHNNYERIITNGIVFNNESLGYLYFDLLGESISPFLNREFMQYAYSIPDELRENRYIYIDWITTLHPDIARFTWEGIGGKPTNNRALSFVYRLRRAFFKRMPFDNMWKKGMNPEQLWYESNENVQRSLESYFYTNLELIEDNQLRNETEKIYLNGNFDDKARCLTLVGGIKLLF